MKKALLGGLGVVVATLTTPLVAQTNGTWINATANSVNASAADQLRVIGALDIQPGAVLRLGNPNHLTAWADGDS